MVTKREWSNMHFTRLRVFKKTLSNFFLVLESKDRIKKCTVGEKTIGNEEISTVNSLGIGEQNGKQLERGESLCI